MPIVPSFLPLFQQHFLNCYLENEKKIDNLLYFQEIIFAWLVLEVAFQSTEESLLWNYFCLICVVVAFQSIEDSLHKIFCSFSNIWDHFIMKAEKLILVVGCHTNNQKEYGSLHQPQTKYADWPNISPPMDRLMLLN